jgi:hypothetical protein
MHMKAEGLTSKVTIPLRHARIQPAQENERLMGIIPNHGKAAVLHPERAAAVRNELNAVLKSSNFSGSKRCQDFLEFIVNQALDGNYEYLTERFLGAELFGRPINYETGTDSIVRVRANDVRRRLAQYYSDGRGDSQVVIELVSGNYIPEFHWRERKVSESAPAALGSVEPAFQPDATHGPATPILPTASPAASTKRYGARLFAGLVAIALVFGSCTGWWLRERTLDRSLDPLRFAPSMNALWSAFVNSPHETDIVLSDVSFQLLEDIEKRPFTLNDYLNRSYLNQSAMQSSAADLQPVLTLIGSKNFGNSSEFRLAERMTVLDGVDGRMHIYNARDYSSVLAAQDNMILIGSQYTNPWQQLFADRLNFQENPPGVEPGTVINGSPKEGESIVYSPTEAMGYCVVAYLPNPDHSTRALLIEGTSSEATEAGGDFLLSEDNFSAFEKILHAGKMPFFEVLLKTSQVRGTPIKASVEAYRTYPNQP